ncbi:MAG: ATP-binding cassette domain-containing protein [Bacteroidetes bacterium]|nr:ATP-binding cassette domain-containing protein [Bacteroidota bacterium]
MAYEHQIDYDQRVIEIRGLYKSFGSLKVLQGVDLDVFKGENVVVLGRSGTGKSVLIKIIAGLLPPDAGTVDVLGRRVSELSEEALRALRLKLGFSFQNSALYDSMSIRENLEFPVIRNMPAMNKSSLNDLVKETLDAVGLLNKIDRMPSELSGGQRKRIGIARTLMLKPEIMLYDEPTAGLDPVTSVEINKLINEVQERYNTSAIIITHDLACAKTTGDRVVMLFEGKVAKEGSFQEVFASDDPEVQNFYNYNFIQ